MASSSPAVPRAFNDVALGVAAVVIVLGALIWVGPSGLLLPALLVVTGITLRARPRRRTVGTYVLCAGVALTILTAIFAYGMNSHTESKIVELQPQFHP
jgi:hypothetical protein